MATSAFKSTTKRTPVAGTPPPRTAAEDSVSSTKAHRRSRSLSRFPRRLPELDSDGSAPRGKFVNTVRGTGFPDISLDDLAIEFFPLDSSVSVERKSSRSRSSRRESQISAPTVSSQRRGRSVSRQNSSVSDGNGGVYNGTSGGAAPVANSGRRRSVSVARNHISDLDGNGRAYNVTAGAGAVQNYNSRRRRSVSVVRNEINYSDGNGRAYYDSAGSGDAWAVPHARRRRSVSVARHHISDYESDIDHSRSTHSKRSLSRGNGQIASLQKPTALSHRSLGRSLNHTDLLRSQDGYSSQSSVVTDDGSRGAHHVEKTIRAVYTRNKTDHATEDDINSGLFEKMKKELRLAVDGIKIELEQAMVRKSSALASHDHMLSDGYEDFGVVSGIRKKYATKVKQSDQLKQDLVAAMALEERRGKDLSEIVRELLPDSKNSAVARKSSQIRKRGNNDRNKMSERLNEEAEKYFEDFISNVEDTDFSSFDGERSDATSSSLSVIAKSRNGVLHGGETGNYHSPALCKSTPVEMEGVNLPWLKWETNNDGSPLSRTSKTQLPVTPKTQMWDAAQDVQGDPSNHSTSKSERWIPKLLNGYLTDTGGENSSSESREIKSSQGSQFDMGEYVKLERDEDLLFENWRERNRISSGGLLLCSTLF